MFLSLCFPGRGRLLSELFGKRQAVRAGMHQNHCNLSRGSSSSKKTNVCSDRRVRIELIGVLKLAPLEKYGRAVHIRRRTGRMQFQNAGIQYPIHFFYALERIACFLSASSFHIPPLERIASPFPRPSIPSQLTLSLQMPDYRKITTKKGT